MSKEQVNFRIDAKLAEQLRHIESAENWTSKTALYEHALRAYVEGKTHDVDFVLIDNAMTKIMKKNFRELDERFSRLQVRTLLEMGQTKRILSRLLADTHGVEAVKDFNKNAWARAVKDLKEPLSELAEILHELSVREAEEKAKNIAIQNQAENS